MRAAGMPLGAHDVVLAGDGLTGLLLVLYTALENTVDVLIPECEPVNMPPLLTGGLPSRLLSTGCQQFPWPWHM